MSFRLCLASGYSEGPVRDLIDRLRERWIKDLRVWNQSTPFDFKDYIDRCRAEAVDVAVVPSFVVHHEAGDLTSLDGPLLLKDGRPDSELTIATAGRYRMSSEASALAVGTNERLHDDEYHLEHWLSLFKVMNYFIPKECVLVSFNLDYLTWDGDELATRKSLNGFETCVNEVLSGLVLESPGDAYLASRTMLSERRVSV